MTCAWSRRSGLWLALWLMGAGALVGCKSESSSSSSSSSSDEGSESTAAAAPDEGTAAASAGVALDVTSLGPECTAFAGAIASFCADPPLGQEKACLTWVQAVEGYRAEPAGAEAACASALPRVREAIAALESGSAAVVPETVPETLPTVLAEPVPPEHVLPGPRERPTETEAAKAQRVLRVVANYLLAHAAEHGAPADQAAAAEVLQQMQGLEWPSDPWGSPYVYVRVDERHFELRSWGPDGEAETADDLRVTE